MITDSYEAGKENLTLGNSKEMWKFSLENKSHFDLECKYLMFILLGGQKVGYRSTCESSI